MATMNDISVEGAKVPRTQEQGDPALSHWINGQKVPAASGDQTARAVDPRNGEPGVVVPFADRGVVDLAVRGARAAQLAWAAESAVDRGRVLARVADAVRDNVEILTDLELRETGATITQAGITGGADYFEFYGGVASTLSGETLAVASSDHTYTRREPYGVVGIITPWNAPFNQASRDSAPALAAGNAVVLKPSEFTSSSSVMLGRLAVEAGLPPGLLNVVCGNGPTTGQALVEHPDVRLLSFTGSVPTAQTIGRAAAERVVPVILELGGKSPNIVFADADLEQAARHVRSRFTANNGQACAAHTRLLVQRRVHREFVERVLYLTRQLRPGIDLGPIITQPQFERVQSYFKIAAEEGLTPLCGGGVDNSVGNGRGYYVWPTIYDNVSPQMRVAREEVFGPVLCVLPFDSEEEAVQLANSTNYGLHASIWTGDLAKATRVAHQLDAGQVVINDGYLGIETPFGGFKASGHGRVKGVQALDEYTQLKTVSLHIGV